MLARLHALQSVAPRQVPIIRAPFPGQPVAMLGLELARQLDHVLTVIAAFG